MFSLNSNGLTILKNKNFQDSELIELARNLSSHQGDITEQLLHWDFGPIMNMQLDPEAKNYLFSSENVPLHWDGAFYKEPRYLLFYCTKSEGSGGETIFLNTEKLWDTLSTEDKVECKKITLIYKTQKVAHYGGEIKIPLVQSHPYSNKTILRMAEKVETQLNPVSLEIVGSRDSDFFYTSMIKKFSDPTIRYVHKWEKGDLIICDNFTYLHGRNAINKNLTRSFKRIQIL